MGRGLMIALGASLALNFFGAGFLLSNGLHPKSPPPAGAGSPRGFDGTGGLARSARYLPAESRAAFRREIRKGLPHMRDQFGELHKQRQELNVLLQAEEFDAAAVAAKLEELRAVREAQHQAFDDAFVRALEVISAKDRQILIDQAERRRERRAERRSRRDRRHNTD